MKSTEKKVTRIFVLVLLCFPRFYFLLRVIPLIFFRRFSFWLICMSIFSQYLSHEIQFHSGAIISFSISMFSFCASHGVQISSIDWKISHTFMDAIHKYMPTHAFPFHTIPVGLFHSYTYSPHQTITTILSDIHIILKPWPNSGSSGMSCIYNACIQRVV